MYLCLVLFRVEVVCLGRRVWCGTEEGWRFNFVEYFYRRNILEGDCELGNFGKVAGFLFVFF